MHDSDDGLGLALRRLLWLLVPILVAMNLVMPPFVYGDDADHFKKSYTLAHLSLTRDVDVGGTLSPRAAIDANLARVVGREVALTDGPARALRAAEPMKLRRATPWSSGRVMEEVPGSAHLPLIYAPQIAAIAVGEQMGLSIEDTLRLARALNGFAALAIIGVSLSRLPVGLAGASLILLALPKTLFGFVSNSLDPLLLASTLAVVAFTYTALARDWTPRRWQWVLIGLVVLMAAGVRPPLAVLGIPPIYAAWRRKSWFGVWTVTVLLVLIVAWLLFVPATGLQDPRCSAPGGLPTKALHLLLNGPGMVLRSLSHSADYYYMTFVGEIGFGHAQTTTLVPLPKPLTTYGIAFVLLLAGLVFNCANRARLSVAVRLGALALAGIYVLGVFFAMAVVCSAAGGQTIAGVQGRYFMPALLLCGLATTGLAPPVRWFNAAMPYVIGAALTASMALEVGIGLYYYWAR